MPAVMFNLTDAEQWARDMGFSPADLQTQIQCFDEEAQEFTHAKTPVERLDALADMLQVIACIKVCGGDISTYYDHFEDYWLNLDGENPVDFNIHHIRLALKEVVRSNYSKFVEGENAASREISHHHANGLFVGHRKAGVTTYKIVSLKDQYDNAGKFVPMGKVLKPVTYFEPNLEQFL
jgi:hypothetical protein